MQIETLSHVDGAWSRSLPVALDGPQTLVLVFGARDYPQEAAALAALRDAFPRSVLAGCSTAGEIFDGMVRDDSLSVAIARFHRTRVASAVTPLAGAADSRAAGARLAERLAASDLRAVFVLSDGLGVNGAALVAGLSDGLPAGVSVSGGLAGDGARFGSTWVLDGALRRSGCVGAVGLYGDAVRVGLGTGGGWADFGPERRITRAEGCVLYELDGQPALDLYKTYLGELATGLPGAALHFPLSVRSADGAGEPLVRTILAIDEATRSMVFAGDLPVDGTARLMRATPTRLVDSAGDAIDDAVRAAGLGPGAAPALVLSVSCVGRRIVLGEHTDDELEAVGERVPGGGHVGFYSYGEIAPDGRGDSRLHNQTMTVTVVAEDAEALA
jgi:hypothetical protein